MNVFDCLVNSVKEGKSFVVDFENKTLKVDGKEIVKDGEYDTSKFDSLIDKPADAMREAEALYLSYKYSYPSESDARKSKRAYFKALTYDEMTDKEMIVAEPRNIAQARLEGFILLATLAGYLTWDNSYGTWFWQSQTEPDLVILKKWIAA